ncbi:MAG: methyltransferase domain-containing protein [Bryobacterales bacterium]|nr:methyltransferase domain-containing protein [Bryobacterales bacterium]
MNNVTNRELIALATAFRDQLKQQKASLRDPLWEWYPYDTLSNFTHLADLLATAQLEFRDLAGGEPVADIGCADGDLSLFLASLGCDVDALDNPLTHHNGMRGVRLLAQARQASVNVHAADLDEQWWLPRDKYQLSLLLGVLYHLKNPFFALETMAKHSRYLLLSTRIAGRFPGILQPMASVPAAYLVAEDEMNRDNSNFWIFTEAALRRLMHRAHWQVLGLITKPAGGDDERAYIVAESRYSLVNVELLRGLYEDEGQGWRWTAPEFTLRIPVKGRAPRRIALKVHLPEPTPERSIAFRCAGHDLGTDTIALSGDHLLTRDLPPTSSASVDVDISVSPPLKESAEGRALGLILASVQIEV